MALASKTTENKNKSKSRVLYNPGQTASMQIYFNQNNEAINVPKSGYHFSNDKEMDSVVEYFKKELGFKERK